jgi:galactonate dehydratase
VAGASLKERVQYAHGFHRQGFKKFKIYYESDWAGLLAQIDELRAHLGSDVEVAVDALWHLDPARAPEIDSHHALWLECPLPPEDPAAHASLARSLRTPVALGESYRTVREMEPLFQARAMEFVQPDLGRTGITEGMRIARRAADNGMQVVPHVSIAMGPQIAAAIHFAAAAPACDLCEYNPRVIEVANRFLEEPIGMENGQYVVPQRPGLGVSLTWKPFL